MFLRNDVLAEPWSRIASLMQMHHLVNVRSRRISVRRWISSDKAGRGKFQQACKSVTWDKHWRPESRPHTTLRHPYVLVDTASLLGEPVCCPDVLLITSTKVSMCLFAVDNLDTKPITLKLL